MKKIFIILFFFVLFLTRPLSLWACTYYTFVSESAPASINAGSTTSTGAVKCNYGGYYNCIAPVLHSVNPTSPWSICDWVPGWPSGYDATFTCTAISTPGNYKNICGTFTCETCECCVSSHIGQDVTIPTPTTCALPVAPGNLSPNGSVYPAGSYTLTWNIVSGATAYGIRINDLSTSWCDPPVADCYSPSNCTKYSDDYCVDDLTTTSYSYNLKSGHSYSWWVHAINACGWGARTLVSVSVPTPTPTNPPAATNTPVPTNTPIPPTNTPVPTNPPLPTNTPIPTNPPVATNTPIPPTEAPIPTVPEDRYATCDLCGFCQKDAIPSPTPGNWEKCRNCLYPALTGSPAESLETLKVDNFSNQPPTPFPGAWYTMIGCISTDVLGGFTGQGAAGSVVQTLLNIIFGVAGSIAFLYILYGSFLILTSQADAEKLNQGKRILIGAVVGIAFTLLSVLLVNTLGASILKIPGFASPTPIP